MSSIKKDTVKGGQAFSAKTCQKKVNAAATLSGKRGSHTSILKGAVQIDGKLYKLNP